MSSATGVPNNDIKQSAPVTISGDQTSRVTTDGSIVQSSDPTTAPSASLTQKLKGDAAGAVKGTIGSLEAAAGTAIGNKGIEAKGVEKMQEEDERLGAKRGVMPVGSDQRETKADAA